MTWRASWFATHRLPRTLCRTPVNARTNTSQRFAVGLVGCCCRSSATPPTRPHRQRMEVSLSIGMRAADEDGVDIDTPDSHPGPEATLAQRRG